MNNVKTGMLLAALTALFGVVGYLLGGTTGMLLALGPAVATNAVASVSHFPNADAGRHPATAPPFIINPLSGQGMDDPISNHPATENRIAASRALARTMGGAGGAPGLSLGGVSTRARSATPRIPGSGRGPLG